MIPNTKEKPEKSSASPSPLPATANRILAALPEETLAELQPYLEPVAFQLKDIPIHSRAPIRHVYFLLEGVASLINRDNTNSGLEVGIIGREGALGHSILLGEDRMLQDCLIQVQATALRVEADVIREQARRNEALMAPLLRFTQSLFNQATQVSACNRLHPIEERCSRWLLMMHDRVEGDSFPITQEFLSIMLGVRRPTVTLVIGMLQEAGYIQPSRGRIALLDREGLEESSCECYGIIRESMAFSP